MNDLKYWLAFNSIEGLGAVSIMKIWKHFASIKEAWSASSADLYEVENIYNSIIEKIVINRPNINPDKLLENTMVNNINAISIVDEEYPYLLKQIYDPPVVLYYTGNLSDCDMNRTVAMVGTRTPTNYGRDMAYKIASELLKHGVTIVSGLAEGIDTCAHTACIENNGKTIAVLGSGLNVIYPKTNIELATQISNNNGLVISEYPPDAEPEAWRFPYRNRVISGLSRATIVIESKAKGGSLITAKNALEHNREVFGVPSRITNNSNEGVHNLIQRGEAKIFTSFSNFFKTLNWELHKPAENSHSKQAHLEKQKAPKTNINTQKSELSTSQVKRQQKPLEISNIEELILSLLDTEPVAFDTIVQKTRQEASQLLGTLTILELKGLIVQVSGKRYKKSI